MSSIQTRDQTLLEALLDSWDRNNRILVNLLRALPDDALETRALDDSSSVGEMFAHMHYVRVVFVSEDAPEFAISSEQLRSTTDSRSAPKSAEVPLLFGGAESRPVLALEEEKEWSVERDSNRMAQMLSESAQAVREAVKGRLEAGRDLDLHYDHPILLLQHMIWHEGYHHGQIKLALKASGRTMTDEKAGPLTWNVWMDKGRQY